MKLLLSQIEIQDLQARNSTWDDTVDEYAEAMKAGVKFPPVTVFHDGSKYHLADGFHRYYAAQKNGFDHIEADVRKGTRNDALWFAAGANQTHGLRRTNADKRKAVEIALKLHLEMSNRAIAEHCGVSDPFVAEVRQVLTVSTSTPEKRLGRDGKKYPPPPVAPPKLPPPPQAPPEREPDDPPRVVQHPPVPQAPEPVKDKIGRPIPPAVLPLWNRGQEVQNHLTIISRIRTGLQTAQDEKDPLYAGLIFSTLLAHLDQAYTTLKTALPYTVCPTCQAHIKDTCRLCKGKGLISEFTWSSIVPEETRNLVLKSIKK